MPAGAIIGGSAISAGAGLFGSMMGSKAVSGAAKSAQDLQATMFQQAMANQAPFIQAGKDVIPTLQKLLTPGPDQTSTLTQLPGFNFAKDVGTATASNVANLRGWGGNVLKGVSDYNQGTAMQYFNNYVQPLLSMFQGGSGSASSLTGNTVQSANNQAGSIMAGGQAQAAGTVGAANAVGGLGGNIGQLFALNQLTGGKVFPGMYGGNNPNPNSENGANTTGGVYGPLSNIFGPNMNVG